MLGNKITFLTPILIPLMKLLGEKRSAEIMENSKKLNAAEFF